MKDLLIIAAALFVMWYVVSHGLFAQLGSGLAPGNANSWQGRGFTANTPFGSFSGGF